MPHRIIPARAGSRGELMALGFLVGDHPRARGEQSHILFGQGPDLGSSPRARGAEVPCTYVAAELRIIPARAGSRYTIGRDWRHDRDHPRARGEQLFSQSDGVTRSGSSPRARGAVLDTLMHIFASGIIPARAGSSAECIHSARQVRDHPRARGEQARATPGCRMHKGSSPRARGAEC